MAHSRCLRAVTVGATVAVGVLAAAAVAPLRAAADPYPPPACAVTATVSDMSLIVSGSGYPAGSVVQLTLTPVAGSVSTRADGTGAFTVRMVAGSSSIGGVILAAATSCTAVSRFPGALLTPSGVVSGPDATTSSGLHPGSTAGTEPHGEASSGPGNGSTTGAAGLPHTGTASQSPTSGPAAQHRGASSQVNLVVVFVIVLIALAILGGALVYLLIGRRLRPF